jgi:hypothetical protein
MMHEPEKSDLAIVGPDPTLTLVANSMTGSGSHLQGGKV